MPRMSHAAVETTFRAYLRAMWSRGADDVESFILVKHMHGYRVEKVGINGSRSLPMGYATHSAATMVDVLRFATDTLWLAPVRRSMVRGVVVRDNAKVTANPLPENAKMLDSETTRMRA